MSGYDLAMRSAHGGAIATMVSAPWCAPMNAFVPDERERLADDLEQIHAVVGHDVGDVDRAGRAVHRDRAAYRRRSPRRCASGAHGERSSHSPTHMPTTRPGLTEDALRVQADLLAADVAHDQTAGAADRRRRCPPRRRSTRAPSGASSVAHRTVDDHRGHDATRRGVQREEVELRVGHRFDGRE